MVNESNKPQPSLEHEQLGQRLAASNQALADMQAEHRQLLEEMEQLKQRAETLQRLREQQEREEEEERLLKFQQISNAPSEATQAPVETTNSAISDNSMETKEVEENPNEQAEEADYIKEKLEEIARLKAQFKRVQHMINTTELIENHISKKEKDDVLSVKAEAVADTKSNTTVAPATQEVPLNTSLPVIGLANTENLTMPNMPTLADLNAAATTDEKEQLIMTMLSMFQDFSSDLKSQADNLRAERARIRELKESIIRSKKQQSK